MGHSLTQNPNAVGTVGGAMKQKSQESGRLIQYQHRSVLSMEDFWVKQYNRMIRWKHYVHELFPLITHEDYVRLCDYFFAFIINCNHLGDWLFESGYSNAKRYRNADKYLDVCRGLANGNKHQIIKKGKEAYKSAYYRLGAISPAVTILESSTGHSSHHNPGEIPEHLMNSIPCKVGECFVVTEGDTYSMFELIDNCIESWDKYLRSKGLRL